MTRRFDSELAEDIRLAMELAPQLPRDMARAERVASLIVVFAGMLCGAVNVPHVQFDKAALQKDNVVRLAEAAIRRDIEPGTSGRKAGDAAPT